MTVFRETWKTGKPSGPVTEDQKDGEGRKEKRGCGTSCGLIELLHVLDPAVGGRLITFVRRGLDGNGIRWRVSISRWGY